MVKPFQNLLECAFASSIRENNSNKNVQTFTSLETFFYLNIAYIYNKFYSHVWNVLSCISFY